MLHKIKYKINRLRYYVRLMVWARENIDLVKFHFFLVDLKKKCHEKFLENERGKNYEGMTKAKIQEELLNKILNHIKL